MTNKMEEILDDIDGTLALIDQAQAHFDAHKHLWSSEVAEHFQKELDNRRDLVKGYQAVLEDMKS